MTANTELTDWQLMRLRDCAGSNKIGMKDRGFPQVMRGLAALGLVEVFDDGAVVSAAGMRLLSNVDIKQQLKQLGGCV